jgi:hypothetical protein
MDGVFSWRKTRASDLAACLKLHPAKNGAETVGDSLALKAWNQLFHITHASRSAVVELRRQGKSEIVGFGFASFVKKSFAEAEVDNPTPGLNSRIIESLVNGNPVIATYEEVRDANTRGDLEQVVLDVSWRPADLSASQIDEVRVLLGQSYLELFSGYSFFRVMTEIVDELDKWHMNAFRTFRILDRYEAYHRANPQSIWNRDRILTAATLESMRVDPYSVASGMFQHRRFPQFAFTRGEQQLLEAALDGLDDASASETLFLSLPAIKRRWANIFERVGAIMPDLCPADGDGTRGIQKRQRILTYVRSHPEELRPFDFNGQKSRGK